MSSVYRIEPVDIERSADGLIRFYGTGAERVAVEFAQKYAEANDVQAFVTWDEIARTILLAKEDQSPDEPGP